MMHVNPALETRALAAVFNPTSTEIERKLKLPLYYAGLKHSARIRREEGEFERVELNEKSEGEVTVKLSGKSFTWYVVEGE